MIPSRLVALVMVTILALAGCASGDSGPPGRASPPPGTRTAGARPPNIVFVLADDLSWNLVAHMPVVTEMRRQGTTFENYFVSNTLCCPSRATILTGRYPHNTQVLANEPPLGGFEVFQSKGAERATFATALRSAGYRTGLLGKYLNGYEPVKAQAGGRAYIPPGWTEWYATGLGYREYDYTLNENGSLVRYGRRPGDYMTDVLAAKGADFITRAARAGRPFMVTIAPFAPHSPFVPARRHAKALPALRAPRGTAFNEADTADKPAWVRGYPRLGGRQLRAIDRKYRARARMALAIDELVGTVCRTLREKGIDRDTYLVFSSDNGFHLGEHRLGEGKGSAYDTDIRVPLIVTGPGVPAGRTVRRIAQNTDLYPTFAELAGAPVPGSVDGRSLVPFLRGGDVETWRRAALVEHHGPVVARSDPDYPADHRGGPPANVAVRTESELYVEYADGAREYYDMARDPDQLSNSAGRLSPILQGELSGLVNALRGCSGVACRTADRR